MGLPSLSVGAGEPGDEGEGSMLRLLPYSMVIRCSLTAANTRAENARMRRTCFMVKRGGLRVEIII